LVALKVLGIIALIIFGFMMISFGADIAYEGGQLRVAAKVCGIQLQLIPKDESKQPKEPKPKKEKKPKKPKKTKKEPDPNKPKKKMKLDFTPDEILSLLKAVLNGLGRFRKMSIDRFVLHYVAAGDDPYNTAKTFGFVNAALSTLAPICARRYRVKESDVWTDIDFTAEKMSVDLALGFSIRIGQVFGVINSIIFGVLKIFIKNKLRLAKEKRLNKKLGITEETEPAETPAN